MSAPTLLEQDHLEMCDGERDSRSFNFSIEESEVIRLFRRLDDCERRGVLDGLRFVLRMAPAGAGSGEGV